MSADPEDPTQERRQLESGQVNQHALQWTNQTFRVQLHIHGDHRSFLPADCESTDESEEGEQSLLQAAGWEAEHNSSRIQEFEKVLINKQQTNKHWLSLGEIGRQAVHVDTCTFMFLVNSQFVLEKYSLAQRHSHKASILTLSKK